MSFTRPTDYPDWTTGNPGVQVQPTAPQKFSGWVPNQRPPSTWFNWILGNISDWILWLDQQTEINSSIVTYDAVVGTNGNFPDINTLMASANIANIKNVLVSTTQTVTTTQVIDQNDMQFTFKPQAWYVQGLSLATCIHISGSRVRINGARFINFNTGISLAVGADNCIIHNNLFNGLVTPIVDLGANNTMYGNVEEV